MTNGDLDGKVALVVGCGKPGGIGVASARALAVAGARVVLADMASTPLDDVTADLKNDGFDVAASPVDLVDESSVKSLVEFTLDTFGQLDIIDNNAAATELVHEDSDVLSMTTDLWDKVFAVNVRGPMLVCKHGLPALLRRGGGSIVNISSGKSLRGDLDEPAYSASKAAMNSLTRTIAVGYGKQGVRCNTIATGVIMTTVMKQVVPAAMETVISDSVLLSRLGEPEDLANLVVFLASDRAAYITGQTIQCDGGLLDHVPVVAAVRKLATDAQSLKAMSD